jgi:DNA-binding transcriptional LysR family regulator
MKRAELAGTDLNLLVVLHELFATRSTTQAARRLGRTQSAVSHALSRLRLVLQDPLFLRIGPVLEPTAFALGLEPAVAEILGRAVSVFGGKAAPFSPLAVTRTFVVGGTDHVEALVLPKLLARLRVEAPGVDLVASYLGDDVERALQARDVDLAIGTRFRAVSGLLHEPVAEQEMRMLVRKGHPATRGKLDPARFASFDHVLVAPRGTPGGVVDVALEAMGLRRRVVLRLPHFLVAALVVAESDLVVSLPRACAEHMAELAPLEVLPVPVPLRPFSFGIGYAATFESDPAHAWFRRLFVEVARDALGARPKRGARRR